MPGITGASIRIPREAIALYLACLVEELDDAAEHPVALIPNESVGE